jgi:hypothetical protein
MTIGHMEQNIANYTEVVFMMMVGMQAVGGIPKVQVSGAAAVGLAQVFAALDFGAAVFEAWLVWRQSLSLMNNIILYPQFQWNCGFLSYQSLTRRRLTRAAPSVPEEPPV